MIQCSTILLLSAGEFIYFRRMFSMLLWPQARASSSAVFPNTSFTLQCTPCSIRYSTIFALPWAAAYKITTIHILNSANTFPTSRFHRILICLWIIIFNAISAVNFIFWVCKSNRIFYPYHCSHFKCSVMYFIIVSKLHYSIVKNKLKTKKTGNYFEGLTIICFGVFSLKNK